MWKTTCARTRDYQFPRRWKSAVTLSVRAGSRPTGLRVHCQSALRGTRHCSGARCSAGLAMTPTVRCAMKTNSPSPSRSATVKSARVCGASSNGLKYVFGWIQQEYNQNRNQATTKLFQMNYISLQCNAACNSQGIKYRILQCVWYGTKKPAGNACKDQPRPAIMKVCKGPPCIVNRKLRFFFCFSLLA